jgi:hypothetical protein
MTRKIYCALFITLILLVAGCSYERTLKLDARLPLSPAVKQNPLHIGVYYSPEFVEYTKKIELIGCGPPGRQDHYDIFFTFPLGIASRDLFEQIIASMFTTVTIMPNPPHSSCNTPSVDGVLEPLIISFGWGMSCSQDYLFTGKISANVSYIINLYDPDGHLIVSMYVEGRGIEKPKLCFGDRCNSRFAAESSIAAEQAMQDAMAKFMVEFQEQPEVKQWLSSFVSPPGEHK